jgi:hypothetical protein
MADTYLWRWWQSRVDWDVAGTLPQDDRVRQAVFLGPVWVAIADLAAVVTDASDDDLIGVLGAHVLLRLPRPTPDTVAALAGAVGDRLEAALDGPDGEPSAAARLHAWLMAVNHALEGKAPAVQFAVVAVFLERVLCARLASAGCDDPILDVVADGVATSLGELLQAVGSRAILPETYLVM